MGGGDCKGQSTITLSQCQTCGYVFNSSFDLEAIQKEYQSEGYFSRKIVSKQMSKAIKQEILLKENIQSIFLF